MRPFIVPCGNGVVVRECCEEVLDQVPGLIQVLIVFALWRAMGWGRDDGCDARFCPQIGDTLLRIIRVIRQKRLNGFKEMGQQPISPVPIVGVPGVRWNPVGWPSASPEAWMFVVHPPFERPMHSVSRSPVCAG